MNKAQILQNLKSIIEVDDTTNTISPVEYTLHIGTIQERRAHYEFPYILTKSISDMGKIVSRLTRQYDECLVDHDGENFEINLERTILKNLPIKNK